jgi:nitrogenase molybdenum-iron protein alpha/beta subunit
LSQGMFDSVFVHIYRTRPGLMTLGVDYEKITAKRLPIEIRDGTSSNLFNLVAFKGGWELAHAAANEVRDFADRQPLRSARPDKQPVPK